MTFKQLLAIAHKGYQEAASDGGFLTLIDDTTGEPWTTGDSLAHAILTELQEGVAYDGDTLETLSSAIDSIDRMIELLQGVSGALCVEEHHAIEAEDRRQEEERRLSLPGQIAHYLGLHYTVTLRELSPPGGRRLDRRNSRTRPRDFHGHWRNTSTSFGKPGRLETDAHSTIAGARCRHPRTEGKLMTIETTQTEREFTYADYDTLLDELKDVSLVGLETWCSQWSPEALYHIENVLSGATVRLARYATYIGERHGYGCGDQGHAQGVKRQNVVAGKVRKALGYTQGRDDINF